MGTSILSCSCRGLAFLPCSLSRGEELKGRTGRPPSCLPSFPLPTPSSGAGHASPVLPHTAQVTNVGGQGWGGEHGLHWAPSDLESLLWPEDGASCQSLLSSPRRRTSWLREAFTHYLIHSFFRFTNREQYYGPDAQ